MAIEAELADGRILEFPDGTDPKVIQNTVKRLMAPAEPKISDYLKDVPKAVGRGATGLLETSAIGASALLPDEYEKAARKGIAELAEPAKQYLAPSSQEVGESVSSQLASGVGSTLPFFALGPAGLLGRAAGAGLGVAAGAGEARQAAEVKGATPEEIRTATQLGAPTGLLDLLAPQITLFKGVIGNALARGGVEGATEAAQKIAQNLIAKGVYDPKQDVLAGSGEEGAYGAGVGALTSLIVDLALGRKGRTSTTTPPPPPPPAPPAQPEAPITPFDTTTPPDTGLQKTIEETTGVNRTAPDITPLTMEEAGRQRIVNLQKKIDDDVAANEARAAREGIQPVVPPTPERPDISKPSLNETQMPKATPQAELEAKQAEIDRRRLAAGLPTGPSSKTPGVQPPAKVAEEAPRTQIVDERPMNERLAKNRLLVMQNMLKNRGGDPASLAIVPHPTAEGMFAIQSQDKPAKLTPNLPATAIDRPETQPVIDPINAYIDIARRTNTPASIRLVRDFEAGIVTREDIQDAIDAEQKAGQPLPLTYLENGEPGIVSAPTYKPRGERFLPPFSDVPKKSVEPPVEPPTETPVETPEVEPPVTVNEAPKTLAEFQARMPIVSDRPDVRSANEQGNFAALADHLVASKNPAIKRIGELARGIASKIKLRKPGNLGPGVLGVYRYNDDSIQMTKSSAGDEHTNAHETLHALISKAQRYPTDRQKPIAEKIVKLYKHVKKELHRQGKNYYGLTNEREFTAEAMTNPQFQYELMQIEYGGRRSAWTEFTRLIADLLGIKNTNALTEVMNLVDRLAQTKQPRAVKSDKGEMDFFEPRLPAFRRWFGKSKVVDENGKPLVVYHATSDDFGSFDPSKDRRGNGLIFFAKDSSNAEATRSFDNREATYVMPVYLRIEKMFDGLKGVPKELQNWILSNKENLEKELNEYEQQWGLSITALDYLDKDDTGEFNPINYIKAIAKGEWQAIEASKSLVEKIKELGYDGIKMYEEGDTYAVFNPNQIKSAIGNKGTYSLENEMIDAMQLPSFGKKQGPTPTSNGQASLQNLASMGRGVGEPDPGLIVQARESWNNARDNPKATAEAARSTFQRWRDRIETWAFSSDAALNNAIRREVMASSVGQEEKIGLLLNASLSQTVHSDAVASLFLQKGGITYDQNLHKWVGVDKDANFVTLSKQLDAIAEKNGLTKPQIELIAHAAFEAKRTQSLIKFNQELAAKIATVQAEAASKRASSPVASSALSEKAQRMKDEFKYIHLNDKQIAEGMEFFKLHPELNEVVKTWNEIRDNASKAMVESGLWSESDAEFLLSNADYVPFYREEQLENGQGPKEFIRGLKVQAKERKLKGSDKPVNDIFDNQVRWVQYSINRAVRNRSAIALADTAVSVGAAKQVESSKDGANVTRIWRDGKEEFYDMADPMFMEAFNGLEAVVIPSWKWASTLANTLRQSVVMYPLFSVAQVPQDSFAAMFSSGLKPQYALRIPILAVKEFIQTLRGKSKSHEQLKNIGAVGVRDFTSAMVRQDAEIFSGLRAPPGFLGKLKYGLNHIAMAADNAVRQAVFEAAEAQGLSKAEAFEKSFEVFNVRRKGSSKTLALASQLIPFFNAYLAAQSVAYKTITGRGTSPQERANAMQMFAATTASVMTMSLLYSMLNGDDDDYLNKPTVQRDRLLMIPGTGGMSIPLRSDLFTMPKIITEHMYLLMTDKGYEDGRKFRESMVNALGSSLLGPTAVPQAIKPIVEVAINHDFFQGRPLIGTYQKKLETERQFTDTTSEFGKFIGSSGLISPIAVDHLTRGMFGSAGGLMLYMTSAMMDSNPDAPRPSVSMRDAVATLPGMSGFMSKQYENGLKRDFYALKEEVDKSVNTFNDLKNRSPQDIPEFLAKEENVARLGLQKATNKISEDLSKIRKGISYITNAEMPADEKKVILDDLKNAEREMLKGIDVKQLRAIGMI